MGLWHPEIGWMKQTLTYLVIKSLCVFLLMGAELSAQVSPKMLEEANVEEMSDAQVLQYWERAKAEGYTLEQLKTLAAAKGVPATRIAAFERRLNEARTASTGQSIQGDNSELLVKDTLKMGLYPRPVAVAPEKSPLFGYEFFNNPNISFTPNQSLATPPNYQLGPGDSIVINIWGAAENVYNVEVDREGAVRIPNVGPVYVSGLTMESASEKIKTKLKRVYGGISAPNNSAYKVFVDIALGTVRTVQVNIIGEIQVPGTYNLSALSTVLNALYASGGPTKQGTFRKIKLVRNGEEVSYFDVYDYLINGSQKGNKTLQDQDVLIVAPYISRISVSGAVKRPGIYELLPEETFSDLLEFTSGFTSNAYKDRIVLERIEGDRKVVREIEVANASDIPLKDGDNINVREIIEKFENRISIEGAVYRPGKYELTDGLTLQDLIEKAAGLTEEAFLGRGILYRSQDGVMDEIVPFSVQAVMEDRRDVLLQADDRVMIYNKYDLSKRQPVSIDGAVNNPGSFAYAENMTIEDLVIMASGFKEGANAEQINVFRKVTDNEFETLSKSFTVTADGSLELEGGGSFTLEPGDRVSVRYLRGVSEQKNVSINGEANFAGTYVIENKNAKISDLVTMAGGLSPYAFLQGATLIRRNPYYRDDAQEITFDNLNDDTEVEPDDIKNKVEFRVGIDLEEILKDPDSKYNMVLKNGDKLVIPSIKETVKVEGEVLAPALVRFDKNYTLMDYIDKSGGYATNAKKGKTYVVYANGDIASTKHFLFFKNYPKIKPGAVILVPSKPVDRNKLSAQEVIGISSGLTTLGLLIDRLLN
ncbi:SLBB domain-containing protein [Flavobacteriaceae bacterium TK19130]|nr:SLBB domain-containing protein [Thermobacterium salinum]